MAQKKVNTLSMKKEVYQFQVACVLYLNLRQNTALKEKIDNCLNEKFDEKLHQVLGKQLNKTVLLSLLLSCYRIIRKHSFSRCSVLLSNFYWKICVC